ncbi:hypothetical protein [Brevibacillus sp. 179-C9.3 HS]|uniref:hypothetical protein n=1 Tax=unclassified Brevibacillus TaxID=2684853 RepID=UPI0039A23FA2
MNARDWNRKRNEWLSNVLTSLAPGSEKPIVLSDHFYEQGRYYSKRDIVSCLITGKCIGWSDESNQIVRHDTGKGVILGRDSSDQQIVIIIGQTSNAYTVVTAFPPLDEQKYGCSVA